MKNNLSILRFQSDKWCTIYNREFKIYFEIEIKQHNTFTIMSEFFEYLDVEIRLSKTQIHFYYENIKYLLSKDPIIINMHLRIILTKLNILNEDS